MLEISDYNPDIYQNPPNRCTIFLVPIPKFFIYFVIYRNCLYTNSKRASSTILFLGCFSTHNPHHAL